jgi:hypothetical protein
MAGGARYSALVAVSTIHTDYLSGVLGNSDPLDSEMQTD